MKIAQRGRLILLGLALTILGAGCKSTRPVITFEKIPNVSPGGPDTQGQISGRVLGAASGDRLVLFTQAGEWWVQPDVHAPFTSLTSDGSWSIQTHLGTAYGALLVTRAFQPPQHAPQLPAVGGDVLAVAFSPGTPNAIDSVNHPPKPFRFGGYDWRNDYRIGSLHQIYRYYLPENAEVDERGALHLHIRTSGDQRTCARVSVGQTLGYGTYKIGLIVPAKIDPAAELNIFTSNSVDDPGEHREMEFHLSRWGDSKNENAEYVIQPDHVAGNVHHFELEADPVTTTLRWSPGRADLVSRNARTGREATRWSFTSGVPSYKNQRLYVSFCPFPYPKIPFSHDAEVVLNKFEFLP